MRLASRSFEIATHTHWSFPALASQIIPFGFTTRFAFEHVSNYDGTRRSVCRRCHSVVATSHYEFPLEMAESTHICSQPLLPASALNTPHTILSNQ